ncbi:MAG: hypothetical protein KGQ60_04485 [Planctomycetes bacterium]|nr:hypothetical protein [Planctomycetota bacterium]
MCNRTSSDVVHLFLPRMNGFSYPAVLVFAALSYGSFGYSTCQELIRENARRKFPSSVQEIIAHRGSSADRPENTMASAQRAIEVGATVIEIDLRTTLDGHLVILHDASVTRTTDGTGEVGNMTLEQIRKLDAGMKFEKRFAGERIPTFEEMLQLAKSSKIKLLLDLKESGREYNLKIAALIQHHNLREQIILGVRSEEQAKELRKELPNCIQLGFIPTPDRIESFREAGVDMIRLWSQWLTDKSLVNRVRQCGAKLQINLGRGTREELEKILPYGAEAILCDDPALLIGNLSKN